MPSNRYSFVRGRPPLMRGNGAAGGGGTRHARHEARQGDEAPAVERQIDDLAVVDDVAEPCVSLREAAARQRSTVSASVTAPTASCS